MIKPELLSPAGDLERLETAVRFGADAVYLGAKTFGMRAGCGNFEMEELARAVRYAHEHEVRVYLTCNTLPRNDEVRALPAFLREAGKTGIDALIVADIGVMALAKRVVPEVELHLSTQTGVVNYETASELYRMGAKRVVLARELTLDEIRGIRENTPGELELEAFCHGAMCMSVSGRCVLSSFLTGRDANRGACAQPCRWSYHLVEEKRPGQFMPVFEDKSGSYILNAKDLSMIAHLDKLCAAGVTSLKIEGRAKAAYYVAGATAAYRAAIDALLQNPGEYHPPEWALEEVEKVSHRAYSTGFYFGRPESGQADQSGGYERSWEVAAVTVGCKDGYLLCSQRNRFCEGEELEVLSPGRPPEKLRVETMTDEAGNPLETARHPEMRVRIAYGKELPAGSFLRRKKEETKTSGRC